MVHKMTLNEDQKRRKKEQSESYRNADREIESGMGVVREKGGMTENLCYVKAEEHRKIKDKAHAR